jgi:hypothetical protein
MTKLDIGTPIPIGGSFRETMHLPGAGSANSSRDGRGGNIENQDRSGTFPVFFSVI